MPDLMRFCSKWIGSTVIEQLPRGFRDRCPLDTAYNKLTGVSGLHHFWKQHGEIKARAYSDIGPVKDVAVQTGVKRASKQKRGTKIDYKRKAAVNAVQWFDRVVGRHPDWVNPPGGAKRCRSEAWGHVSCERFIKATKDNSVFSAVDMLCWDAVDKDMRKLVQSQRYVGAGIVRKPSSSSTPHTLFTWVGDMELLYLGTLTQPSLPVPADLLPTQAHLDHWEQLERSGQLPFEGQQTGVGASAAGVGASRCAATGGACRSDAAGDGDGDGCVPVSTDCCPQVELPEDEDDDDDDL